MSEETEVEVQEAVQPSEAEVKASRLGWVPKDEFKGDPDQWRDAEEFLKRGEEIHGYLKADLDRLHGTLSQRDKEIAEMRATMEEFRKFHNETEARAYKRAIEDLKQLKVEAIESGDGKKVVEIDEQIDKLKEAQKKPAIETPQVPPVSQDYVEWLPNNKWYVEDAELKELAEDFGEVIRKKNPSLVGKAFLDEVTKRVKLAVPEKFENPNRNNAVVTTGSDSRTGTQRKKKGYNDLPAEAKAACDRFVKQGLMTVEQYVKEYDFE